MKKSALLVSAIIFLGVISCKDTTSSKEEQEQELAVQKIDSLEREIEEINQRIDSISREAEQTVEELN